MNQLNHIIILILLLFSANSRANVSKAMKHYKNNKNKYKNEIIAYELMRSRYFFSAAIFAKEHLKVADKINNRFEDILEKLILRTGTMTFMDIPVSTLGKFNSPSLNFLAGIQYFKDENYSEVVEQFNKFPEDHRFTPEAKFILATSLNLLDKNDLAHKEYDKCIANARFFEDQAKNKKLRRYFAIIAESCTIHKARILFKESKFEKSIVSYESIPKTSFRWPFILLEKAWSNYYSEDYNRALGLLVTYKSPLLSSYFMPEAEVLTALSYFKLCLWEDTLQVIDQYYSIYKTRSEHLKKILLEQKSSHTYFLKMLLSPINENKEKVNPFIRVLATQIRKKIKFSLDLVNYNKINTEYKHVKKLKKSRFKSKIAKEIYRSISWRAKHLNHYIKKQMFDFVNKIHRFSYEMFNIRLEVMSLKRDLIYTNKILVSNRSRGTLKNVNRRIDQHFYSFDGEFWGDELGDYSFGLKSNCKRVKKIKVGLNK